MCIPLPLTHSHLPFFQVERGYHLHRSGDYIATANEFSTTNWIWSTNMYLKKIISLTDDNWKAIFEALYQLQESCACDAQAEAGAGVDDDHEALLPDDPLSPVSQAA